MTQSYLFVGLALLVFGLWYIFQDLFEGSHDFFRGIDTIVGFTWILIGAMNLLNWAYGRTARGVKYCAIGANAGVIIIALYYGGVPSQWDEWVGYILTIAALMISLSNHSHRVDVRAA